VKTAAIGVDVDSLIQYYRIHGLPTDRATNAAWTVGVPRFVALFAELGVPATFYCVAEDLETDGNAQRVRALAEAGHEIGNHTWHHRYDLCQMRPEQRRQEVAQGQHKLQQAAGAPVVGFRSPGYNTSAALQADLVATGHRYDSSVFPCVPYYSAKAAVMGLMRVRGRRSKSILGSPRVLFAPRGPYQADAAEPHRAGTDGLQQYPVSVALGVPLIGTAFTALGPRASVAAVAAGLKLHDHLTLEFHAVDLMGLIDDGLDPVLSLQPDLKVSVARKQRTFHAALSYVARHARVSTLAALT
jgi:peptidoglycan/xylan/chitin deacetylase (PgdA/CDA1 family)